ncbi:hypothetical protein JHK85_022993 [Glycine max]|nr:hypothetical protein JHK85_022993 [Glycine max]KAG5026601.1 hypothetical protein JHK86_022515 [Glycine max]
MLPRGLNLHRDLGSLVAASASGFQLPPLPTTTPTCAGFFRDVPPRKVVLSIEDFGGGGDGKTSNTKSFRRAIRTKWDSEWSRKDVEGQLIEEAEHSPTNQGKNKLALRKCRAELITSLQLLGDYESLLTPPQLVLVEANQAAAKAIMFLSGNPVGSGCFKYMSTNDMPMKCSGNLRHLIVEACIAKKLLDTSAYLWPGYIYEYMQQSNSLGGKGNGQGGSGANGTITGKAYPKGLYGTLSDPTIQLEQDCIH